MARCTAQTGIVLFVPIRVHSWFADRHSKIMNANPETTHSDTAQKANRSNLPMLCIAWLVVGIPLAWGVAKSVKKSLPLFNGRSAAAPALPSSASRVP